MISRLSAMYSFARQKITGGSERTKSKSTIDSKFGGDQYTSHKCEFCAFNYSACLLSV